MKFNYFYLIINILLLVNNQITNWWIYDSEDHDLLFDQNNKNILNTFLEDQTKCDGQGKTCYLANTQSASPFENKCCQIKTSTSDNCLTIFSGKYHNTNLYSLDKNNNDFSYDCNGKGFNKFDSSKFSPNEKWEIKVKEKLDCIYSKTEEECKNLPKSFNQNTKCCWFSNDNYLSYASCFGLSEITDKEFNRTIPYLTLATFSSSDGAMDFRCYDKSDKIVKGIYNLKFSIAEMGSVEEKLLQELLSDDSLNLLSNKHSFIKIKEYDKVLTNSFDIWTVSPHRDPKPFTISVKFSYSIVNSKKTSKNRNLEIKTEEKLARCEIENIDTTSNLNITTSKCSFSNDEKYIADKIEIQPGHDLIGKFDDENKFATPGSSSSDDELKKMNETAYFFFKDPITNVNSYNIEGEITQDRKNVEFVLYHQKKDDTIQNIIGKANFLKDKKSISFTTEPKINFEEGITIIPNQLVKSEDGEYIYLQNKVGKRNTTYQNSNSTDEFIIYNGKKSSGLSTGGIIAIVIPCCLLLIAAIAIVLICNKCNKKQPTKLPITNQDSSYYPSSTKIEK